MHYRLIFFFAAFCLTANYCSSLDTNNSNPVTFEQIGKSELTPLKLKCSFEKSSFVATSITILNGKDDVLASITEEIKTEVKYQTEDVTVKGSLSKNNEASLTVYWKNTTVSYVGKYSCIAQARSANLIHLFHSSLDVTLTQPTLADVISFSRTQASLMEEQSNLLYRYSNQLKQQQEELKKVEEEIQKVGDRLVDNRPEVKEGIVHCGSSSTYARPKNDHSSYADGCAPKKEKIIAVSFDKSFSEKPSVSLHLRAIDMVNNSRFSFEVRSVYNNAFEMACSVWCETVINALDIQWIARVK